MPLSWTKTNTVLASTLLNGVAKVFHASDSDVCIVYLVDSRIERMRIPISEAPNKLDEFFAQGFFSKIEASESVYRKIYC